MVKTAKRTQRAGGQGMPGQSVSVSALDEIGDRDAPVGSRSWALWVVGQAKLQRDDLDRDLSALRRLIGKVKRHEAWKVLGVSSFDILCETQFRLSSGEVAALLDDRKAPLAAVLMAADAAERVDDDVSDEFSGGEW